MTLTRRVLIPLFCILCYCVPAQKVGLVLSGGGALGVSHIGAIKALEENNIPIDYITGTSAGAMVGSMYAAGFSPGQMESFVTDEKFQLFSSGDIETKFKYYFRKEDDDASWVKLGLSKDMDIYKAIPTNLTNPVSLDFENMSQYSAVSAKIDYNFDSLLVPFRCVASDISSKRQVVFSNGHINQAVRASMTYPGYIKPITVDGCLLFDGGLYNNFPSDIMYDEFFPDIIIGVNFTDSAAPPDEDDAFSQLKTMIVNRSKTAIMCENGILIEPKDNIGVFDFSKAELMIKNGYDATMLLMDSIKKVIGRRVSVEELNKSRRKFRTGIAPLIFDEVLVEGVNPNQAKYIKNALIRKNEIIDLDMLKKRYFRLVEDKKIKNIYPLAELNARGYYTLRISVKPEKPYSVKFGGVFSSRPINTGYLGLEYFRLGKFGLKLSTESYFGKYYGSIGGAVDLDANFRVPINLKLYGYLNRWDYFKSFATFFEDVKPSYIIENEKFLGTDLSVPISNFGKVTMSYNIGEFSTDYYQTEFFSASDTADVTSLALESLGIEYSQSSLNRKMYPTEGGRFSLRSKYYYGFENTYPGSTSTFNDPVTNRYLSWYFVEAKLEKYFTIGKKISLGIQADGVILRPGLLLDNYTATAIASPVYQPIPESKTIFIPEHVSHDYVAGGLKAIYKIKPSFSLRAEGYTMKPYVQIKASDANLPFYDVKHEWQKNYYLASGSFVYDSPLGPISLSANYYSARTDKWSFIFKFGYLLYNRRFMK